MSLSRREALLQAARCYSEAASLQDQAPACRRDWRGGGVPGGPPWRAQQRTPWQQREWARTWGTWRRDGEANQEPPAALPEQNPGAHQEEGRKLPSVAEEGPEHRVDLEPSDESKSGSRSRAASQQREPSAEQERPQGRRSVTPRRERRQGRRSATPRRAPAKAPPLPGSQKTRRTYVKWLAGRLFAKLRQHESEGRVWVRYSALATELVCESEQERSLLYTAASRPEFMLGKKDETLYVRLTKSRDARA